MVRREKVGKINHDLVGKHEESPREDEMYKTEVQHVREKRKSFTTGRKRKHARGTEKGSDRCSVKKETT